MYLSINNKVALHPLIIGAERGRVEPHGIQGNWEDNRDRDIMVKRLMLKRQWFHPMQGLMDTLEAALIREDCIHPHMQLPSGQLPLPQLPLVQLPLVGWGLLEDLVSRV